MTNDEFTLKATAARPQDPALVRDIRYLWWALSEIRGLTKEGLEVLDCSVWGDAIFATLMTARMMPCEAHYLYVKKKHHDALAFRKDHGADCVTVPILDGKVPTCNPYDVIIIDCMPSVPRGVKESVKALKNVLAWSMWRFTRIFVRNGYTDNLAPVYKSMSKTMVWSRMPHTSIVHGCMSESWRKSIAPPS